jgi:hypothetical protein
MGTIIKFPADAAARRPGVAMGVASNRDRSATIMILPVIRIERDPDGSNGQGPEEGTATGRRRKRRARS